MNHSKPPSIIGLLLSGLAIISFSTLSLQAEDVIVTGCVGADVNGCPPSCTDGLGTTIHSVTASIAVPMGAPRSQTLFAVTNVATWTVMPTLGISTGVYRIYVSQGSTNECSTDIHVKITATDGCSLADLNQVPQTEVDTTAFQRGASLNVWTPVAIINNHTNKPIIKFSWASGGCDRWYMDEVRFENIAASQATPARIMQVLYGNPLTISGTGPVSRPFALVSSPDAAQSLNQWTPEQTNTAGTGSFTFSVTPGTASARFFRVITQ